MIGRKQITGISLLFKHIIRGVILTFIINSTLFSQEKQISFIRYTAQDGLSNNYVTKLLQDSRGILWVATRGGVCSFDGYNFTTYGKNERHGASNVGRVTGMVEDNRGNIWLASLGTGFFQYIKEQDFFIHYKHDPNNPNSLKHDDISNFLLDSAGNLLYTTRNGTQRYNPKTKVFDNYAEKIEGVDAKTFNARLVGRNGILWSGSRSGITSYDPKTKKVDFFAFDEDIQDGVDPRFEDEGGNIIWCFFKNGLGKLDVKTRKFHTYSNIPNDPKSLSNNQIFDIYKDSKSNLWIATADGLNIFNPETEEFIRYYHDPRQDRSISDNTVTSIMEDNNGNVWFGTRLGLNKLVNTKFTHYYKGQSENSIVHNNVHVFYETNDRKVWIGTSKGVEVYDLETQLFMRGLNRVPEELTLRPALHLTNDHNNNIWVGTWNGGLLKYDRDNNKINTYLPDSKFPQSIASRHIFYIFEDSKNRIWCSTWGKGVELYNLDTDNFTHFNLYEKTGIEGNNYVSCIIELNNKMLFGTVQGIVELVDQDNKVYKQHTIIDKATNTPSTNNFINCFHLAKNGWLLIGTNSDGMYKWDFENKSMYRLKSSDLLTAPGISSILEDDQNNLWVGTKKGLSKISNAFVDDSVTVMNYKVEDGLQGEDFLERACLLSKEGTMYFGGTNGFNKFRPENVTINTTKPQVIITNLQLFNKKVNIKDTINGQVVLNKSLLATDEINLSYKNNFLTIEFSALHYLLPEKNKYEYILEGFDKEWIPTDATRRYATYTDLKGGEYLFKVKGSNADGIWNETPKTLKITVTPPFWRTKWFIITSAILLILLIYYLIKLREKQVNRDKMILQEQLQKGEQEMEKQRSEIEKQGNELKQREAEGRDMKWYNEGLALFSDIISRNKGELKKLTQSIISKLIEYVEAEQGAIYIINDDDESEQFLELSASYALDAKKIQVSNKILIGESLVGTCFKDKEVKQVDDIPNGYSKINSGLGSKEPNYLLLVPIRLDESIVGVIELASFKKLEGIKIPFLEKLAESVTSIIVTEKANDKMQVVLQRSELQATQMQEQEEEMRQNIEELRAQREETAKKEELLVKEKAELKEQVVSLTKELTELKK